LSARGGLPAVLLLAIALTGTIAAWGARAQRAAIARLAERAEEHAARPERVDSAGAVGASAESFHRRAARELGAESAAHEFMLVTAAPGVESQIEARPFAFSTEAQVELEVVDDASGALIAAARVARTGPGLAPEAIELGTGRGTLGVRTRLPFDLSIEAQGYAPRTLRQIKLARGEDSRVLRIALRAR
jgi:hypothetical protein